MFWQKLKMLRLAFLLKRAANQISEAPPIPVRPREEPPEPEDWTDEIGRPPEDGLQPADVKTPVGNAEPAVLRYAREAGYQTFTDGRLNLIGVRNTPASSSTFDDEIHAVWLGGAGLVSFWVHRTWRATTDPGAHWLKTPMNPKGCAILAPGQYVDAYALGLHKGRPALVQVGKVAVYRDTDRDVLPETRGTPEWGYFGINIHDAPSGTAGAVAAASAGCQVLATEDLAELLDIVQAVGVNEEPDPADLRVTYTLIPGRTSWES